MLQVQIIPVGFEFNRILAGILQQPSNIIILLSSDVETIKDYDERGKLLTIASSFIKKIQSQYSMDLTRELYVKPCSFINFKTMIKNICDAINFAFSEARKREDACEIWINVSTGNKIFANAAMYAACFFSDKIKLFYTSAKNYTVDLLFDKSKSIQDIRDCFEANGLTYSLNALEDYSKIILPVIPSERYSTIANDILAKLYASCDEKVNPNWVTFKNLLKSLSENLDKTTRMRYHHHMLRLEKRGLILVKPFGSEKKFILTDYGVIMSIICAILKEYLVEESDINSHD